jgi:undecaprenyl-diphosphatase
MYANIARIKHSSQAILKWPNMKLPLDLLLLLKAALMGIIEGLTEFLPISSTGHLIIFGKLLAFEQAIGGQELADTFEIFIQLGAILAVVAYFSRDLFSQMQRALHGDNAARLLLLNVAIAFVPAAIIGFVFRKAIKAYLFNPISVALAMIVGGIILLWVERLLGNLERAWPKAQTLDLEHVRTRQALGIGLAQIASLWSGMSRSASTLVGGLLMGLDRPTALRFSFYLSIPTLVIASLFDLVQSLDFITMAVLPAFAVGLVVSFVVALVVIKFFLGYVARHNLVPFAWYRIVSGVVVLLYFSLSA